MNKEQAINKFIEEIYTNNTNLVLKNEDIKKINKFYKETLNDTEEFEEYIQKYNTELGSIKKLKSGTYEVKKQYEKNKALQAGILSECNYIETLAKLFNLNKCIDLDKTPYNLVPIECSPYIKSGMQTFSCARYLYYNKNNFDIFIFQYGNPAAGDAEIIINGNKVRLEFKEQNSKAGEYDITGLYDENGKLIISMSFKENTPELVPFIEKFNEETNVIEQIGHNYSEFDEETKLQSIHEYFLKHGIDILITSAADDSLIALTPDCLDVELSDGTRFITTDNSEIRTSGRNHRKVFTVEIFNKTLKMMNAIEISEDKYKIDVNQKMVEVVNARGTKIPSRVKFRNIFFVEIDKVIMEKGYIIFDRKDVEQLVPSISMHIKVNTTKEKLKEYFEIN